MKEAKIYTQSKGLINLFELKVDDISIKDISNSLSKIPRYLGHNIQNKSYTVAEHSIILSNIVPSEYKLEALLHDATEAYIGDIVAPLKSNLIGIQLLEESILEKIIERFNLSKTKLKEVEKYDISLVQKEAKLLFPKADLKDFTSSVIDIDDINIDFLSSELAAENFLIKFYKYVLNL